MNSFIVYVETNWLVSCVMPHHEWQQQARELLDAAERGECTLRIPIIAFLEARHVVARETEDHSKNVVAVCAALDAVARNLKNPEIQSLAGKVREVQNSYRLANPRQEIDSFIEKCKPFGFSNPIDEQHALDVLSPVVKLQGKDIVDLHVLSAIAADRQLHMSAPAAVLSTNSKEFELKGDRQKLPADFYTSRRLVYVDNFDLQQAMNRWNSANAKGWPLPTTKVPDPRRREAQSLVQALPDTRLDVALELLRKL